MLGEKPQIVMVPSPLFLDAQRRSDIASRNDFSPQGTVTEYIGREACLIAVSSQSTL